MKTFHKILIILLINSVSSIAFAQNKDDAKSFVKQGIALHDEGKYAEAIEKYREAIKLDPKHASRQRTYALATYGQDKRGVSLLAWCSFLMLEPQSQRSIEAYNRIKTILNYGIKRTGEKSVNITVSTNDLNNSGNLLLQLALTNSTENKTNLTAIDSLQLQLKSVFNISKELEKNKGNTFFSNFYAKYFTSLNESENITAFTRLVSLSAYKEENLKWFKENSVQLEALNKWITSTKRDF